MSGNKTRAHDGDVEAFLDSVENEKRRRDAGIVMELMGRVTGEVPTMWGDSIIGFGRYRYKYKSGREGDWFLTGLSPRKSNLSLYIMAGFDQYDELMRKLGKFKTGRSCLYVNKIEDVDLGVLEKLIEESVAYMKATYE